MGVLDHSRHPISKALARSDVIVGQARLTVNPSAFMRARAVRMYACSVDEVFHAKRQEFQAALFDVLKPILGAPDVREVAAKGVYGGALPSWWRDLEGVDENPNAGEDHADAASTAEKPLPMQCRTRCRFGAECYREGPEHRGAFAHPGDADWDPPAAKNEGCNQKNDVTKVQAATSFALAPRRLTALSRQQVQDFNSDLKFLAHKFGLNEAELACCKSGRLKITLSADEPDELISAKTELTQSGLLEYYMKQASKEATEDEASTEATEDETCVTAASLWEAPPLVETDLHDKRIDPEDAQVWTWDSYRCEYEGEFTLEELREYWQTMPPH